MRCMCRVFWSSLSLHFKLCWTKELPILFWIHQHPTARHYLCFCCFNPRYQAPFTSLLIRWRWLVLDGKRRCTQGNYEINSVGSNGDILEWTYSLAACDPSSLSLCTKYSQSKYIWVAQRPILWLWNGTIWLQKYIQEHVVPYLRSKAQIADFQTQRRVWPGQEPVLNTIDENSTMSNRSFSIEHLLISKLFLGKWF